MHTINIIDKLDTTHNGPEAKHWVTDEWQEVFLNQGSLDGACGHYCLFMSLIINGVISRKDALTALSFKQDGRTNIGKLASRVKNQNFFHGTLDTEIEDIFDGVYSREVEIERYKFGNLREFVVNNIKENHPVMLGISWPNGGHWVTVVGLDYEGEGSSKELYRFLVIDPSGKSMRYCPWNGVISVKGTGGPYPYEWWGEQQKVKLEDALAIRAI
ncbi:cysteine peptidase family C39 domain-containing protein [Photobacterium alginatilyticum]|uniref:Peptidase C39-like domain-containing protein n=1 Tax=Photobacterium alginatilyticum TaxID=1775171 RepID=A0ABW9YRB4_9GAMM|nr:hypothetical protein [Photobacterium alginatilyticum]NBI56294.1 hypothetical protein [Photobacterium alginatilyticum]